MCRCQHLEQELPGGMTCADNSAPSLNVFRSQQFNVREKCFAGQLVAGYEICDNEIIELQWPNIILFCKAVLKFLTILHWCYYDTLVAYYAVTVI
jgi:hypothetical protein